MKMTIFTAVFAVAALTFGAGDNPVFNGSFELGTDGFALERYLRPDTNPKLEFRALATAPGAPEAGKNSLKIENPFAEKFDLFSKEFRLKPDTSYQISCRMRSSTENSRILFRVFKIDPKWKAWGKTFKLSKDWKKYSFTFTTEKKNGNGYYHFRIGQKDSNVADIFLDDLRITEENAPAVEPGVDAVAVSDRNLYQKDEEAKLTLKAFNPTSKTFDGPITVTVTDEYTKKIFFKTEIPLKLASGEVGQIPLEPLRLNRYGGFRITVSGKDLRNHDGFFAVFGKYEAKPFDIFSDAVVAFNGGTDLQGGDNPAYHVYNAPLERRFEIYALAGCRILRDHDSGVRGVDWISVQPNKGNFDFSFLDFQMKLYDKYNITLFPVIGNGHIIWKNRFCFPKWANLTKVQHAPPNCMRTVRDMVYMPDDQEYSTYIYETAKHLKGRIPVYEILNEPNLYLSPENYIRELKIAHDAIRKADPDAKISAFCLTSDFGVSATAWTQQCVKLGGLKYADAIGFHPYSGRTLGSLRPADQYIADLRKEMKSYGRGDIPLWNTELYYLADTLDLPPHMHADFEAHHAIERFLIDLGEGAVQSIAIHDRSSLWKPLLTPNFLFKSVNFHELVPSEILVAYNTLARLFERSKRVGKFRYENGIICYVFRDQHKKLIAALWNYQGKTGLRADLSAFQLMDLFGNEEKAEMKTLNAAPYFLTQGGLSEEEFLEKIKNLKIVLNDPVSAGEFGRLAGDTLLVTLHNSSAKPFTAVIGLNGKGLTARKTVKAEIPAKGNVPVEIPVKIKDPSVNETVLVILVNGNMFRKKIKIVRNPMINKTFEGKNFKGNLEFGNGEIRVRLTVQDPTDAGPTGKRDMWETDCVELFFDTDPQFIPERFAQKYTQNTFQILITPRDGKISAQKSVPAGCKHSVKCEKDSYTIDFSFPAKTGKYIGFECKIDDYDAAGKKVGETQIGKGAALFKNRCSFVLAKEK